MPDVTPHPENMDPLSIALLLQRVNTQYANIAHELAALKLVVGWSGHDERGELVGEGLAGDLCRHCAKVDARFARDDLFVNTWRARAIATGFTVSFFGAILWWAFRHRLEEVLLR